MEQAQQRLAEIINTINKSLPDGNDLKGFAGISKVVITDSLKMSDAVLTALRAYDSHFEAIFLKRELADLFSKIIIELEGDFEKIKPAQFNSVLKTVSKVNTRIKEVYASVVNIQPIRTEVEITKAKEDLALLTANIEELKKINTELTTLKDSTIQSISGIQAEVNTAKGAAVTAINSLQGEVKTAKDTSLQSISTLQAELNTAKDTTVQTITTTAQEVAVLKESASNTVKDLEAKQKASTEHEAKINEFLGKIETHKTNIETIDKNTTLWNAEIKKAKEEIAANSSQYEGLATKSKSLQTEIETAYEKMFGKKDAEGKTTKGYLQETEDLKNQIATFLAEQEKSFLAQFNRIEGLLPGATSVGLAKAYREQKESYDKPIARWSVVFVSTISIMTVLSIILIYIQIKDTSSKPTLSEAFISFLKDLPFFIPTIWLAVFASKQQSQNKRLQQEYAFKEANAKSFDGHKKQIEELAKQGGAADKEILSQLMAQLVIITSENPSQTLDNKYHNDSPPIFKLIEKFSPSAKKQASSPNATSSSQ